MGQVVSLMWLLLAPWVEMMPSLVFLDWAGRLIEVLIGLPGCKAISSLRQHVIALHRVISHFPVETIEEMFC